MNFFSQQWYFLVPIVTVLCTVLYFLWSRWVSLFYLRCKSISWFTFVTKNQHIKYNFDISKRICMKWKPWKIFANCLFIVNLLLSSQKSTGWLSNKSYWISDLIRDKRINIDKIGFVPRLGNTDAIFLLKQF